MGMARCAMIEWFALWNFRFDKLGQEDQRFLPAQVAGRWWDHVGNAFLGDAQVCAYGDLFQSDGDVHFAWEIGVVEGVGVADLLVGGELGVFAAEGVRLACGEVGEGHFVAAADFGVGVVDFASEAVGGEPFGFGIGV